MPKISLINSFRVYPNNFMARNGSAQLKWRRVSGGVFILDEPVIVGFATRQTKTLSGKWRNENVTNSSIFELHLTGPSENIQLTQCTESNKIFKIFGYLRFGTNAIAIPHAISKRPTARRYHFDGTLKSKVSEKGNTLAYFTNSFLWNKEIAWFRVFQRPSSAHLVSQVKRKYLIPRCIALLA